MDTLSTAPVLVHSIMPPPEVAYSFDTLGWKMVFAGLMVLMGWRVFVWIKRYRLNAYRRQAIRQINDLQENVERNALKITKEVAMKVYGRRMVASLVGKEWLDFMDQHGKSTELKRYLEVITAVMTQEYDARQAPNPELVNELKKWIRTHVAKS